MKITYHIIDSETWRMNMVLLWDHQRDYHWIPLYSNPYGMVQYTGKEIFEKVLVFPIEVRVNNEPAGWACIYNISDTHIRSNGVYVKPEFRGMKLGVKLYEYSCSLWPEPWHTCIAYFRTGNVNYFNREWKSSKLKDYDWRARVITKNNVANDYDIVLVHKRFR